jgi:glycosyltransferase involved in cell wall biosynthesis
MWRRPTIGISFEYRDDWIGGAYYVRNLACALNLLPEGRKPDLALIGNDTRARDYLQETTNYPRLTQVPADWIVRTPTDGFGWLRRLRWRLTGSEPQPLDLILLGTMPGFEDRAIQWVPDFQEKHFPEFFPATEVEAREVRNRDWFGKHRHVMVSSHDVVRDLATFYGEYRNVTHVIPFASFLDRERAASEAAAVRAKHGLPERYFMCSNQLWRHKNHAVVIEAVAALGGDSTLPPVIFTGAEFDYRDPDYAPRLKALPAERGVADHVRFLGFLPREEQLALLAGAIAVIQPSLCEGWSTVIEDAKALGQRVLASDIAVHREQLAADAAFFPPHDANALAALLQATAAVPPSAPSRNYAQDKQRYADNLLHLIGNVIADMRARHMDELTIVRPA